MQNFVFYGGSALASVRQFCAIKCHGMHVHHQVRPSADSDVHWTLAGFHVLLRQSQDTSLQVMSQHYLGYQSAGPPTTSDQKFTAGIFTKTISGLLDG